MPKLRFPKASQPPSMRVPALWFMPLSAGALNSAMVLGQLASFEKFTVVVASYGVTNGQGAVTLAIGIAALEILSLAALLRLSLSWAMRLLSAAAVLLVPLVWLSLSFIALAGNTELDNPGWFGAFLPLPPGWWLVLAGLAYAAYSGFTLYVLGLVDNEQRNRRRENKR